MHSIGKSPVMCMDCDQEATVNVASLNPLCLYHARIYTPNTDTHATCSVCSMSYNPSEWDRCPNDDCPLNNNEADNEFGGGL